MKNKLTYILALAVFCQCFFYLQGCKEPLIQDNNLLTSDDDLSLAKDTLSVKSVSVFEKPLNANNAAVSLLGSVSDPNFGTTFTGLYAQCLLTTNNVYFGSNPVLQTPAFLMVQPAGVYGKFDQTVNISVYELAQDMNDSTTYKTNTSFAVNIPPIGTLNGFSYTKPDGSTPVYTDSIHTIYGTLAPHLRIPLTTTFGNKLLLADTTTILRDNTAFVNYFKGFYLTTSSATVGNGLMYMNLLSPVSAIILYYHNDTTDSLSYRFPISGVSVNHFDNIYTGTPVNTSVASTDPNGQDKVYVQAGAGVKGKLTINLDSIPKNIAINKAELIITETNDTSYPTPLVLSLFRIDDAGQEQHFEDEGLTGYGGVRTTEVVNGATYNRYRFNIKRYFQKLLRGIYPNHGFYLEAVSPVSNSERVVLANSASDKNYKITLVVTYTKL